MRGTEGDYLSRPRFLAISEFGPGALVYHEGSRYEVRRVQLPVRREHSGVDQLPLDRAKRCEMCGTLHDDTADVCVSCAAVLPPAMGNLLRMSTVTTRRRERISSDEEERRRQGFDLLTAVALPAEGPDRRRQADVADRDGQTLAHLTYADTATIRRMNIGLRRRSPKTPPGYLLDVDSGFWVRRDETTGDGAGAGNSREGRHRVGRVERVIPYVEDRRNALVVEWAHPVVSKQLAGLQYALKRGLMAVYDLEDSELAVEALPSVTDRRRILLYEAAEGGAGVLRRLVTESDQLDQVAREALTVLHFYLDGTDLDRAPNAVERCERACYDCLLSYTNQPEHRLLDRHAVLPLLLALADSSTRPVPEHEQAPLPEQVSRSPRAAPAGPVERPGHPFVLLLREHGFREPDAVSTYVPEADACPDFVYQLADGQLGVFVRSDEETEDAEERLACTPGWRVVRLGAPQGWLARIRGLPSVFGTGRHRDGP